MYQTTPTSRCRPFPTGTAPRRFATTIVVVVLALLTVDGLGMTAAIAAGPTTTTTAAPAAPAAPVASATSGPTSTSVTPAGGTRVAGASPDGQDLPFLDDPRVDPDLEGVSVDTPEFREALARYRTTERNVATARATYATAVDQLTQLAAADARLVGTITESVRRKDKSDVRLAQLRRALAQIAVDDYVRGDSALPVELEVDPATATRVRGQRVITREVRRHQLAEARINAEVVDQMTAAILDAQNELDDVRSRTAAATTVRDRAHADDLRFSAQLAPDATAIADARLTGPVPGLDFTFVVLDAYYKAAKTMAVEKPECGIRWTLLAAIGRTESRHGTYGGATVGANGDESQPILGIALDGANGTSSIGDTDGGEIDGDPTTDRAVGPAQFIPSTWKRWARDGNGDGRADPQNMYDATLTAAAYLCYFGPGLGTDAGERGVIIHYNNSSDYVDTVFGRAQAYDQFTLPKPARPRP